MDKREATCKRRIAQCCKPTRRRRFRHLMPQHFDEQHFGKPLEHRESPGAGVIGFISPVSEPYCGGCNRMRLTADGRFHLCLLRDDELDVRAALRAVGAKPTGHDLRHGVSTSERSMHHLGG